MVFIIAIPIVFYVPNFNIDNTRYVMYLNMVNVFFFDNCY